jgi:Protein of unknown function (DUF3999)
MKKSAVFVLTLATAALAYDAAIPYFARTRNIAASTTDRQNYFAIDADIWKFARKDLSDLRIYDGQSQVPYALIRQSGGSSNEETSGKILNLGSVGGRTEFDIDVGGVPQYERVRLELDAKDFINGTQAQGRQNLGDRFGTDLGSSTLYDFTAEGLGSNFVLKFPTSSFPYLHIRMAPGISPKQVKRAFVSTYSETRAAWSTSGDCKPTSGSQKESTFECSLPDRVPLERLAFDLFSDAVNFNRTVIVSDERGNEIERASISRVRLNRAGQSVTAEDLTIDGYPRISSAVKVIIENGDDKPLPIEEVRPLTVERRIYFDPSGKATLQLYYGDAKLEAPTYDYTKVFQQSPSAAIAQLGPPGANPQFTARPDERPWSERHQALLWIAMLLAVAVLGALALRGMKRGAPSEP